MDDNEDLLASLTADPPPEESAEPPAEEPSEGASEPEADADSLFSASEAAASDLAAEPSAEEVATAAESTAVLEQELESELASTTAQLSGLDAPSETYATEAVSPGHDWTLVLRDFGAKKSEVQRVLSELELKAARPQDLEEGRSLFLSRLDEYRALMLAQDFWRLGLCPELKKANETAVSEVVVSSTSGAPSVILPGSADEVWVTTTDAIPGYRTEQVLGLVSCHRSLPRRFFRELEAQDSLSEDLVRWKAKGQIPSSQYELLLQELTQELQEQALSKGANAVVGVELEFFSEIAGFERSRDELRILLSGSAVHLVQVIDLPANPL